MGDFNHGHIQRKSLESTGGEDQRFLFLIQDNFLIQYMLEPTRGENEIICSCVFTKLISGQCQNT